MKSSIQVTEATEQEFKDFMATNQVKLATDLKTMRRIMRAAAERNGWRLITISQFCFIAQIAYVCFLYYPQDFIALPWWMHLWDIVDGTLFIWGGVKLLRVWIPKFPL